MSVAKVLIIPCSSTCRKLDTSKRSSLSLCDTNAFRHSELPRNSLIAIRSCVSHRDTRMDVKPIRTEKDYDAALARIEELWDAESGTPESDELEALSIIIKAYEEKSHPIEPPDPIEAIKFRMEQMELSRKDLEPFIGHRGRVAEVLNRKRRLSIDMIRKLSKGLEISAEVLIATYALQSDKTPIGGKNKRP